MLNFSIYIMNRIFWTYYIYSCSYYLLILEFYWQEKSISLLFHLTLSIFFNTLKLFIFSILYFIHPKFASINNFTLLLHDNFRLVLIILYKYCLLKLRKKINIKNSIKFFLFITQPLYSLLKDFLRLYKRLSWKSISLTNKSLPRLEILWEEIEDAWHV